MSKILKIWNYFWFARVDTASVGVFRLLLGPQCIFFFLFLYPNWDQYYSLEGLRSLVDLDLAGQNKYGWSLFEMTETFLPIKAIWGVGLLSAIAFTVGFQTRLATIALFLIISSMIHRSPFVANGEDFVYRMLLFYGMFAPLGHSFSVDAYLRKRRAKAGAVKTQFPMRWAICAMQINFLFIYANSLPHKIVDDSAWLNGDAIYYTMANSTWWRGFWPELSYMWGGIVSKAGTFFTVLVEGLAPILIWFKRTWLIAVIALAGLHLGIATFLNGVTFFSLSMIPALWLFVPTDVTHKLADKIKSNRFANRFIS